LGALGAAFSTNRRFVSLHPYFKAHLGKLDAIKALLPKFTDKTAAEKAMLFYEFSWKGRQTIYFTNWKRLRNRMRDFNGALRAAAVEGKLSWQISRPTRPPLQPERNV
jgi:hypothetical protein